MAGRVAVMKRMGWDGGPNGTEWNVGGASEKEKQDKEMFVTTQNELKKVLFPGDGQVGIYFELADPKVYLNLNYLSYCEAQGQGRAKGRPFKVTQRSFIDGGWWISFP